LKKGERIKIKIGKESHYVGVINVSSDSATINISSTPQQAIFKVGERKQFEVTNDTYYDFNVTLNSINGTYANLTVLYIYEKMPESALTAGSPAANESITDATLLSSDTETQQQAAATSIWKSKSFWIIGGIVLIIIAGAAYYFFFLKKKRIMSGVKVSSP